MGVSTPYVVNPRKIREPFINGLGRRIASDRAPHRGRVALCLVRSRYIGGFGECLKGIVVSLFMFGGEKNIRLVV